MQRPASEDKKLEWNHLIKQQRLSGLSIEKWCLQNQIRPHTFRYWKEKLFEPLQKSSFAELPIKRPDAVLFQIRGLHIRMDSDCDPGLRKQLFALLAEVAC